MMFKKGSRTQGGATELHRVCRGSFVCHVVPCSLSVAFLRGYSDVVPDEGCWNVSVPV